MIDITLVIPLKNEEVSVVSLLESIKKQSLQPDAIILVDGGSTDNTVGLLKTLIGNDPRFRIIEAGPAMPGVGRNIGAAETKTEWIAFTDAGIRLDENWLQQLVEKLREDQQTDIVYGNYFPVVNNLFDKWSALTYVTPLKKGKIRAKFIASCLMRKKVWEEVGGFPGTRASEDLIFMEKVGKAGFHEAKAPRAMVYWQLRQSIRSTYKRFDLYSKYNVWAGRQKEWQYPVLRQYLLLGVLVILGIFHSWYWLLGLPFWLIIRVGRRIFMHRGEFGIKEFFNPLTYVGVAMVTLAMDLGTFTGWIKALVTHDSPGKENSGNLFYQKILSQPQEKDNTDRRISLVIPVYNESETIGELLETIKLQTHQPSEVIIVDANSTDNTVELIGRYVGEDPRYRIIHAGRKVMPGTGRNIGVGHARYDWIAFTDAGIILDANWLNDLAKKADENMNVRIVYGDYAPLIRTYFDKICSIAFVPGEIPGHIRGTSIASCLLKKEVWEKIGGFPPWRAAEDLAFMEKAEQAGFNIAYAPSARIYWKLRSNLASAYKKFEVYSKYNVLAGQQRNWHYGVARQYLFVIAAILLGIFHSPYWLLLIPLWMIARVVKRTFFHRHEFGIKEIFNPFTFFGVMLITFVMDVGTFSGWIKAIFSSKEKTLLETKPAS